MTMPRPQYIPNHISAAEVDRLRRENRTLKRLLVIALIAGTITWFAGLLP